MKEESLVKPEDTSDEVKSGWGSVDCTRRSISLERLEACIPEAKLRGAGGLLVHGIRGNSREVRAGDLFFALEGFRTDGNDFIRDALQRGAVAVGTERADMVAGCPVPCLIVPDARLALAFAASAFYGHPSRELGVIGVTGTDGKTTTASMVHHLLNCSDKPSALLSTVEVRLGGVAKANDTDLTTPEAPTLQAFLADGVAAGMKYAVLEVSSHSLALHRVAGCNFDVGVFTNLSPEHLDFHGDIGQYLATKARLFAALGNKSSKATPKAAVINIDDCAASFLSKVTNVPVVTYGIESNATVRARNISCHEDGTRFEVITPDGAVAVHSRLKGTFNVYNWLAAVAAAATLGVRLDIIPSAVETMEPLHGRMQPVECGQPFRVMVDFAHTPNALRQTLETLRMNSRGRLIAVIGHPGGRYRQNRPRLGRVAANLCDFFVIAGDDPYDEEPEPILVDIAVGAWIAGAEEGRDFVRISDRRMAFAQAFEYARPGDTILLAGRGHLSQWVSQGCKTPFDDALVAASLLRNFR